MDQVPSSEIDRATAEPDLERIYRELREVRQELEALRHAVDRLAEAAKPALATGYAHIVRIPGVHGGRPVVRGTGVSVQAIVEQVQLGRAAEQIVEDYGDVLTLAQVYAALSYFHDHQAEIEQAMAENRRILQEGTLGTDRD